MTGAPARPARIRWALPLLGSALVLAGCPQDEPGPADDDDATAIDDDDVTLDDDDSGPALDDDDSSGDDDDSAPAPPPGSLFVRFLGVGGVSLRYGDDLVLTAPMFTNPDLALVTTGAAEADTEVIDAFLLPEDVTGAAAILVGHGHYDHLLDVPYIQELSGDAVVYGNRSVSNLLAGLEHPGPDHLVALNDPDLPRVDTRMCPEPDPCTGEPSGEAGEWVDVPGANARLRALCAEHPAQFLGVIHFGEGCVEEPLAAPPASAEEWREGATLAYLVDFLDDDGEPVFRVYYQDAPTNGPIGHAHADLLDDKRVDVAVLNVGSYDAVADHPAGILSNLDPRYALGIHWETFFSTQDQPIVPIPFHADPAGFDLVAREALTGEPQGLVRVDGFEEERRYWRPWPGTLFEFPADGVGLAPDGPEASTEIVDGSLALRTPVPFDAVECDALDEPPVPCEDLDGDGLVDAWEDLALDLLRPTVRFDEAEPYFTDPDGRVADVGRVAPAPDGSGNLRAYIMIGYSSDYGRCALTMHDGDSERVALDLAPLDGGTAGDVIVQRTYTAAHEGTATDHGLVLAGEALEAAEFPLDPATDQPRWLVYSSDGKHATYHTIQLCEDAEWAPCLDEDCAPDGVLDPAAFDLLPPVHNAGELDAPRLTDLGSVGFPGDDAWLDQDFCGGLATGLPCSSSVRSKLLADPFDAR